MRPVKIAMMSLTHGHTRKYYQTLRDSPKLEWVAACAENDQIRKTSHCDFSRPCCQKPKLAMTGDVPWQPGLRLWIARSARAGVETPVPL